MREVQTHTIGDCKYTIQQLGAKAGRSVFLRLLKVVAPAADAPEDTSPIPGMVAALNDADLEFVSDHFARATRVSPTPDVEKPLADIFDDHFAGKYGAMMKWLWKCVEVNYGGFFLEFGLTPEALELLLSKALGKTPPPSAASSSASSPAGGAA